MAKNIRGKRFADKAYLGKQIFVDLWKNALAFNNWNQEKYEKSFDTFC
jgi:hypothetical protein